MEHQMSFSACHKNLFPSPARHYSTVCSTKAGISLSCVWLGN